MSLLCDVRQELAQAGVEGLDCVCVGHFGGFWILKI